MRYFILSGAGLSRASGIPTFRDSVDGLWEGHRIEDVASPIGWHQNRAAVKAFYDARRIACEAAEPNAGHRALAELQRRLGPENVTLVTQNVDGLLQRAGAQKVLEVHGSLFRLRCPVFEDHPRSAIHGAQGDAVVCMECGNEMRPAIVWFGENIERNDEIESALDACDVLVAVGTSGVVQPSASYPARAARRGAHTIEVNPEPSGNFFREYITEPAETALPRLLELWFG